MHKQIFTLMSRIKFIVTAVFPVALIMCGCNNGNSKTGQMQVKSDSVEVFILKKASFDKNTIFPGELIPYERAEIYAKVPGYIHTLKADIGDILPKGKVLIVLDAPEIIANYAQASADVQAAKAKYAGSRDAYNRILNADKVPGTVATGEKEKLKSQYEADSSAWLAEKSKLNAYAQLKNYLTITAPFTGVITQRNVDPGTLVGAASTKPMLVLENNSNLRLRLPVPEAYTAATPENAKVTFAVDAYPGVHFEALLSRKAGALNPVNRTESWEFIYDNAEKKLKPGMFANCRISFKRSMPSFVVPSSAIVTNQEKQFIIRLNNGKAEWVDTRSGFIVNDSTEVFGALSEGDTIVLRGNDELKPGKKPVPEFK